MKEKDALVTSAHIHLSESLLKKIGAERLSRLSVGTEGERIVFRVVDPSSLQGVLTVRAPRHFAEARYSGCVSIPPGYAPGDFGELLEASSGLMAFALSRAED